MGFWTFVVVGLLVVCAGVGVFHPIFGMVVFGAVAVVLSGILILVTCIPSRGGPPQ